MGNTSSEMFFKNSHSDIYKNVWKRMVLVGGDKVGVEKVYNGYVAKNLVNPFSRYYFHYCNRPDLKRIRRSVNDNKIHPLFPLFIASSFVS